MGTPITFFIGLAAFYCAQFSYANGSITLASCGIDQTQIETIEPENLGLVCSGVESSISFFKAYGLNVNVPIKVKVLEPSDWPKIEGFANYKSVIGVMDKNSMTVYMTPLATIIEHGVSGFLKTEITPEIYASYVNHEVSHIFSVDHHYRNHSEIMPSEQSEFVSYIAQLNYLGDASRELILKKYRDKKWTDFEKEAEINQIYHLMNPHGFAIKSYRYSRTSEGQDFLARVFRGEVRPNRGERL